MFFKDKINIMAEVFKKYLNEAQDRWMAEIEEKGEARIDMTNVFERIYNNTITHINYGAEGFNDHKFMIQYYDALKDTFTEREVSMREAVH